MDDYWVEMGTPYTKDEKEYHQYVIMGQSGEVMNGERTGSREEVEKRAQHLCAKLQATIEGRKTARFIINGKYKSRACQARGE